MRSLGIIVLGACLFWFASCGASDAPASIPAAEPPISGLRGLILFIGDGMGHEHIRAGGYFLGRSPSFSSFPTHTTLRTRSADSAVTDSAAAATAIATGVNVGNGVLSLAIPGSGERLETLLERSAREGKLTGLATTTYLTHATPAAFGAHQPDRSFYRAIGIDLLYDSRPNVLLGGGEYGMHGSAAAAAGYAVVQTLAALQAAADDGAPRIAGLFGAGNLPYESEGGPHAASYPDLADMTAQALRLLGAEEKGFFLMIESGLIDKAAHSNDAARMVGEVAALDRAVSVAVEWAAEKQDILIIVTADHETGGITMVYDNGAGNIPSVSWTTTGHTAENVDLFAAGVGAERLKTVTDNSGIYAAIYQ